MDGLTQMDRGTNGWMDGLMDGPMDGWTDQWTNGPMGQWTDTPSYRCEVHLKGALATMHWDIPYGICIWHIPTLEQVDNYELGWQVQGNKKTISSFYGIILPSRVCVISCEVAALTHGGILGTPE